MGKSIRAQERGHGRARASLGESLTATMGPNSRGMIAEGEFKFGLTHSSFDNSLPSFSEISGKKNLGDIVHLESRAYVVLTKNYDCSVK